jgi:hypothetical protein
MKYSDLIETPKTIVNQTLVNGLIKSISSLVGMDGTSNLPANGCQNYDLSELTEKLQAVFTAPWNGIMLDNAASYDLNNVQHHLKETDPPYHR